MYCSASRRGSGSFHFGSALGSTNNRLHAAAGAINLRAAVDPEAVGYAFEGRFQISPLALFPGCRAVERALRARHRRYEPLAFRHDWPPSDLCRPPIFRIRSVTQPPSPADLQHLSINAQPLQLIVGLCFLMQPLDVSKVFSLQR